MDNYDPRKDTTRIDYVDLNVKYSLKIEYIMYSVLGVIASGISLFSIHQQNFGKDWELAFEWLVSCLLIMLALKYGYNLKEQEISDKYLYRGEQKKALGITEDHELEEYYQSKKKAIMEEYGKYS